MKYKPGDKVMVEVEVMQHGIIDEGEYHRIKYDDVVRLKSEGWIAMKLPGHNIEFWIDQDDLDKWNPPKSGVFQILATKRADKAETKIKELQKIVKEQTTQKADLNECAIKYLNELWNIIMEKTKP